MADSGWDDDDVGQEEGDDDDGVTQEEGDDHDDVGQEEVDDHDDVGQEEVDDQDDVGQEEGLPVVKSILLEGNKLATEEFFDRWATSRGHQLFVTFLGATKYVHFFYNATFRG